MLSLSRQYVSDIPYQNERKAPGFSHGDISDWYHRFPESYNVI